MVGGVNIQIKKEPKSVELHPDLVAQIWLVADALKIKSFKRGSQSEVMDDHVPLIEAGIPTIDLIEFDDYRDSGTQRRFAGKLLGRSLEEVGPRGYHVVDPAPGGGGNKAGSQAPVVCCVTRRSGRSRGRTTSRWGRLEKDHGPP